VWALESRLARCRPTSGRNAWTRQRLLPTLGREMYRSALALGD
jgi:hypothetical protein